MKAVVAVWVLVGTALALSLRLSMEYLRLTSFVPVLVWAVIGLSVGMQLLWQMRHKELLGATSRHAAVMIAAAALFVPIARVGGRLTEYLRFQYECPRYERVLAIVTAQPPTAARWGDGELDYIVDPGPPVRVAFPWPQVGSDTWCGVVHDPSAEVMQAGERHWFIRGRRVTSCRPLGQAYYLCCLP
jgi:hypothetical protein